MNSLRYAALVALAAALGHLTFRAATSPRTAENGNESQAESAMAPLIELSNFSARRERSADAERLSVSLRLRSTARLPLDCYVYLIASNEHVSPKLWAAWPPQARTAVSTGGHFRSGLPPSGEPTKLTPSWTRINAVVQHPLGRPPFDAVMLYVVSTEGEILLERPFAL